MDLFAADKPDQPTRRSDGRSRDVCCTSELQSLVRAGWGVQRNVHFVQVSGALNRDIKDSLPLIGGSIPLHVPAAKSHCKELGRMDGPSVAPKHADSFFDAHKQERDPQNANQPCTHKMEQECECSFATGSG